MMVLVMDHRRVTGKVFGGLGLARSCMHRRLGRLQVSALWAAARAAPRASALLPASQRLLQHLVGQHVVSLRCFADVAGWLQHS